jgi:hypothetical protein
MKVMPLAIAAVLAIAGCGGKSEATQPVSAPTTTEPVMTEYVPPESSSGQTSEGKQADVYARAFSICASVPVFKQARKLGVRVNRADLIYSDLVSVALPDIAFAYADAHDGDYWKENYDGCLDGLALAPRGRN